MLSAPHPSPSVVRLATTRAARSPVIWPARFSASRLRKSCPAFVSAISPRERLLELLLLVPVFLPPADLSIRMQRFLPRSDAEIAPGSEKRRRFAASAWEHGSPARNRTGLRRQPRFVPRLAALVPRRSPAAWICRPRRLRTALWRLLRRPRRPHAAIDRIHHRQHDERNTQ